MVVNGKDGSRPMLQALRKMPGSLWRLLGQVHKSTESFGICSAEIASSNQDLSQRVVHAGNLRQKASSMAHLTGTVQQSADFAQQANQRESKAAEVAVRG